MSKSTIGLKNVVAAILKDDPDGGTTTYDPVFTLVGAIDAQVSPDAGEADVQHADDVEYDALTPDGSYTVEMELAGIPTATIAKLQGHQVDAQGGVIVKAGDTPPYIALGFKSRKSGKAEAYRHVWLYKCRPEIMGQTYHTKEGDKVTRQTAKLKLKAIARVSDGLKQFITDAVVENFFQAPYTPTPAPDPAPEPEGP